MRFKTFLVLSLLEYVKGNKKLQTSSKCEHSTVNNKKSFVLAFFIAK